MKKFNDSPLFITSPEEVGLQDTIEIIDFAKSIAKFIDKCETPITIGLQGDWGSGKTSLMNMIKFYLSETPDKVKKFHQISINTWHYSMFRQDEYLGIVIVKSLVDELIAKFEKKKGGASDKLRNIGDSIASGLKKAIKVGKAIEIGIPGGGITIHDFQEAIKDIDNSLQVEDLSSILYKFKIEFAKVIANNVVLQGKGERIVFFIDDLDRIRPIKALEVLETLKNFMDVEGCVFVLAVDYEIVQLGIAEKFGKDIQRTSGKSFFDKIIQLPFSMPTSSYNIEKYVIDLLTESNFYGYDFNNNPLDRSFFVDITEVTVGRNPRSIKRAINYATLLEIIRTIKPNTNKDEVQTRKSRTSAKLLYAIVCMQIAWPELFEFFLLKPTAETIKNLENWEYLDKLPNAKKLFERVSNVDEVKDNIASFFDTLYSILDVEQHDGVITDAELKPLLEILKFVKLTSDKTIIKNENPLVVFRRKLEANDKNSLYKDFFDNIYSRSYWATNDSVEYKKTSDRYFTIVWNRKQLGSLVTLKTKPFLMRIIERKENIVIDKVTGQSASDEISKKYVKELDNAGTLTGIGDTEIDINELIQLNDQKKAIEILNQIFNAIVNLNS